MALWAFQLARSLTTGRATFMIMLNWDLKADRKLNPTRYWTFVAADVAWLVLFIFFLGRSAITWAGL
jgi:hypothetical protein